jgi:hypothetical protein
VKKSLEASYSLKTGGRGGNLHVPVKKSLEASHSLKTGGRRGDLHVLSFRNARCLEALLPVK